MKKMNKLACLLLALVMVFGLATAASAATIEIVQSESGASVEGHTYEVYQIFKGVADEAEKVLSDVEFGANYAAPEGTSVEDAMAALQGKSGAEAAAYLQELITGDPIATLKDGSWSVEVDDGYYLIIDVSENLPETETSSAFILEVLGDTEVKSKHEATPITYKKVDDINDSTSEGAEIEWHDSADHDIGDLIDFQLTAVLPSSFDAFEPAGQAYPFTFHDVESDGLEFHEIERVYVVNGSDETDLVEGTDYTVVNPADDCSFEVYFEDLTKNSAVKGGSKLVVEYKSELTAKAIIGSAGNPNKMHGEFRNLNYPEQPEFTPWDTVIVFTFKTDVNKVDPELKPLSGAEFALSKFIANEEGSETYKGIKGNWSNPVALDKAEDNDTIFSFKGLDDGYYRIEETKTPNGYNTIDPIYFTVTAEHVVEAEDPALTDLQAEVVKPDGTAYTEEELLSGKIASFTATKETGSMATSVVNEQGVELPETGGMGTTIFYILGAILVLGAVVVLVTRKRMAD